MAIRLRTVPIMHCQSRSAGAVIWEVELTQVWGSRNCCSISTARPDGEEALEGPGSWNFSLASRESGISFCKEIGVEKRASPLCRSGR
jgi:hypothetical protein